MTLTEEARSKVGAGGRVVIPAEYRRALGLRIGDPVILRLEHGQLRILTQTEAVRRAQEIVRRYVAPERSLADELLVERHQAAERE